MTHALETAMAEHTPTWSLDFNDRPILIIDDATSETLAIFVGLNREDAHKMKSAPELLAACEQIRDCFDDGSLVIDAHKAGIRDDIESAIAKAREQTGD